MDLGLGLCRPEEIARVPLTFLHDSDHKLVALAYPLKSVVAFPQSSNPIGNIAVPR